MQRDALVSLKARYEQDELAVQVGGSASNLSRVAWLARRVAEKGRAVKIFRESKDFAEWAAAHCPIETQSRLAELQLELAIWERSWGNRRSTASIAEVAEQWAAELLEASGLLDEWSA